MNRHGKMVEAQLRDAMRALAKSEAECERLRVELALRTPRQKLRVVGRAPTKPRKRGKS